VQGLYINFNAKGIEVHHMLKKNDSDFQHYQNNLLELGPVLQNLAKVSKVIWLHQYPTIDFYGNTHAKNTIIHSAKVHQYNEAVQKIFKYVLSILPIFHSS
jgi:hypothetical protein